MAPVGGEFFDFVVGCEFVVFSHFCMMEASFGAGDSRWEGGVPYVFFASSAQTLDYGLLVCMFQPLVDGSQVFLRHFISAYAGLYCCFFVVGVERCYFGRFDGFWR